MMIFFLKIKLKMTEYLSVQILYTQVIMEKTMAFSNKTKSD